MVKTVIISRVADGLPLAASMDDEEVKLYKIKDFIMYYLYMNFIIFYYYYIISFKSRL